MIQCGIPLNVYKSVFPYSEFRNSTSAYDEYEAKRNKKLPLLLTLLLLDQKYCLVKE